MDKAILTVCVGDAYERMAEYTHPTLRRYAERMGDVDFISINKSNRTSPHWEKFEIYNLLNTYKRILYIDTDTIVREDCPNLFNIVPEHQLGAFNEAPFTEGRLLAIDQVCKDYGTTLENWNGKYYNSGILVISRIHKYLFKKPEKETFNFYEQSYLNLIFSKSNTPMFDLPYKFNRMTCMDKFTGEERFASYIIHYAGYPNLEFVLSLIPQDLRRWNLDSPKYQYKRHIVVDVQGGLGDQIDAEPAVRYMKEHVYPEDDINIKTHFPRVFQHLNLPTFLHEEFRLRPDTPYYHIISLPGPETIMWSRVSNLLCHTVDYTSMAILRRILPSEDKQIKLTISLEGVSKVLEIVGVRSLNDLVLVHPGKHWNSKTFPISWWQKVIDGLYQKVPVCLIGAEDDLRGTLDVEVRGGVIDTRNLLDLDGLFALISAAKILVSNDSAPVHVAGAFDNHIVLIPTCKHWEHILPYRRDPNTGVVSVKYKTAALCKKLTLDDCDSQPTSVHGSSAEFIKKDWNEYLPEPEQVIQEVIKRYNS